MSINDSKKLSLDITDDSGKIVPIEDFMQRAANIYRSIKGATSQDFIDFLIDSTGFTDEIEPLSRFQFVDRKLYLNKEIDEDLSQFFLEKIQYWNAEDEFNGVGPEETIPIQIYINSVGGDLDSAFQIVDTIRNSQVPIETIVTGSAYSGALLIAVAGHHRSAFPHATFMFHEGSAIQMGDAHKIIQQGEFYQFLLKQIKELMLKYTKISAETYEEHQKDDWYFGAKKALKMGVIDKICHDVNGEVDYEDGE